MTTDDRQPLLFEDLPSIAAADPEPPRPRRERSPGRCVRLDRLPPDPKNSQSSMEESALQGLAESIRSQGLLPPLLVGPSGAEGFVVFDGHPRLQAAAMVGLAEAPVIVVDVESPEEAQLALQLHHADLDAVDEAEALAARAGAYEGTDGALAARLGIHQSRISRARRIAALDDGTKTLARERRIAASVLVELASDALSDADRARLLGLPPERLTREAVRAAVAATRGYRAPRQKAPAAPRPQAHLHASKTVCALASEWSLREEEILAMTMAEVLALTRPDVES